jgi:hypothetical protein
MVMDFLAGTKMTTQDFIIGTQFILIIVQAQVFLKKKIIKGHQGYRKDPMVYNETNIYFRGETITKAILK